MEAHELIGTTDRVTVVVWALAEGRKLTTADVARMTGLRWKGAYRLLCRVSRIIPIRQDIDGWVRIP